MAGYFDRVRETSSTSGTGTFTLAGAATGFRAFSSVFTAATQVVYYCATDGTNWEIGQGTYTLSGTTLSRTNILASSNSGSVVNFAASGFQVFHTWPARAANEIYTINVVDYGATGNGTTDDTVAINAAIAAANAYTGLAGSQRGVRLWFPGGLYLVGATTMTAINGNGIVISGEGRGASTILVSATATTYSVFTLTSGNEYCEIRNLQIFAAGAQTAGAYITTSGANDVIIDSVVMSGAFNGIVINGSSIKVSVTNVVISSTVATGTGIVVNNGAAGDTYPRSAHRHVEQRVPGGRDEHPGHGSHADDGAECHALRDGLAYQPAVGVVGEVRVGDGLPVRFVSQQRPRDQPRERVVLDGRECAVPELVVQRDDLDLDERVGHLPHVGRVGGHCR